MAFAGKRLGASFKGFFKVLVLPASGTGTYRHVLPVASKRISWRIYVFPPSFLIPPDLRAAYSSNSDVIDSWYLYRIDSADKLEDTVRRIADLHEVWSRARCD